MNKHVVMNTESHVIQKQNMLKYFESFALDFRGLNVSVYS